MNGKLKKRLVLVLLLLIIVFIGLFNPLTARLYTYKYARKYDLDSDIFYRQIKAESSFRFFVVSKKDAIGLGQVKLSTAHYRGNDVKRWHLYIPWKNLDISGEYMRYLLGRFNNNYSVALSAYNWGETNVDNLLRERNIDKSEIDSETNYAYLFQNVRETYAYLGKILND